MLELSKGTLNLPGNNESRDDLNFVLKLMKLLPYINIY
jgi:hypothetical protein